MPCYQQVVGHAWSCIAATGYSVFVKEKQVYLAKSAPSENCSFCRSFSTACLSNNARLLENSSVSCFSVLLTVLSFALELTTIVLITTSTRFLMMACWSFLVHIDRWRSSLKTGYPFYKRRSTFVSPSRDDFIVVVDDSRTGISPHRLQARKPLKKCPTGTAPPSVALSCSMPSSSSTSDAVPPLFSPSVGLMYPVYPSAVGCCLC